MSTTLPILQDAAHKCGCGGFDSERTIKLENLASEFKELVARSITRNRGTDSDSEYLSWPEQLSSQETDEGGQSPPDEESDDSFLTGQSFEYSFSLVEPLRLGTKLSFHKIDGKYLWMSTYEAGLLVLDQGDHELFKRLTSGEHPSKLVEEIALRDGVTEHQAFRALAPLLGRVATAGFLKGIRGHTECKIPTPGKFARFHLTKACHLECIHCYAESSPRIDRSNEMSIEKWTKLTRGFAANGGQQILFTGGEALMHTGCIELMRLAKQLGLYVTLFTNGLLIPRHVKELSSCVDKVQVSLDGPNEETNDAIRGKGVFRGVIKAIDALLGAGISTQVGMTVMEENWNSWKTNFLTFAQRYASESIEFKLSYGLNTYGRAEHMSEIDVNQTRPTVDALMSRVNGRKGPKIFRAQSGCGYGEQLVVGPDGTVYPCHLLDVPICNIADYDVPHLTSLLSNLARLVDVDHVEGCKECDIRYLCGGTCRVIDGRKGGSRFQTTCTPEIKDRKYRAFVDTFSVSA